MSILTNDEVIEVYFREKWDFETSLDYERAIESAVLEKLAGMELPEPMYMVDVPYEGWEIVGKRTFENTDESERMTVYTATQLRQAYAQGAASQLISEPLACIVEASDGANMVWPIADLDEARTYCADDEEPVPLYALKTAK